MLDKPVRIEFLKKMHLFLGLTDTDLTAVAEELQELTFDEPGTVFAEGSVADSLHIIYAGQVNLTHLVNAKQVKIASYIKGDYYGEQGLLRSKNRGATATAEGGTIVLVLSRAAFVRLLTKVPGLRHNFAIMMYSRQLAQELHFPWLSKNEIIYFLGRKHQFLLIRDMLLPFFLLFPVFGIIATAFLFSSAAIGLIGGFLLVADLAWGVWRYVDWGNDYYIVTNQRVIWLEKVIGFYDSRTEASMGTILSVNTEMEYLGRIFDFGTVVVRTYTGQIRMAFVGHPRQAAAIVEENMNRAREVGRKADEETMKQVIRAKLGLTQQDQTVVQPALPVPPVPVKPAKPVKKPASLSELWKNAFRMRTVDGNIITYHKHIFGFLRDAAPYALGILACFLMVIMWPFFLDFSIPLWLGVLTIFAVAVLFAIIVYEYVDWQNDIYQVTSEQIIDVTRKPFGTEDRKAAPLENILSTENRRNGILGMLLNFGTVYIMVGDAHFNFDDVADPPSVQQDIVQRQQGRLQKKKDTETSAERERMSDWLAMYHRTMDDVEREKNQSRQPDSE